MQRQSDDIGKKDQHPLVDLINMRLIPPAAIANIPKELIKDNSPKPLIQASEKKDFWGSKLFLDIFYDATLGLALHKQFRHTFFNVADYIHEIGQFNLIDELNKICPDSVTERQPYDKDPIRISIIKPDELYAALTKDNFLQLNVLRKKWETALKKAQVDLKEFQESSRAKSFTDSKQDNEFEEDDDYQQPDESKKASHEPTLITLVYHFVAIAKQRYKMDIEMLKVIEEKPKELFRLYGDDFRNLQNIDIFTDPRYSPAIMQKIINDFERYYSTSPRKPDRWAYRNWGTCHLLAAGGALFEEKDVDKAKQHLLKAREYTQKFYDEVYELRVKYGQHLENDSTFGEPVSAFYLGDICQTLGRLSSDDDERKKYFQEAADYYGKVFVPSSGIASMSHELCADRVRLMGLVPVFRYNDENTRRCQENSYPYALAIKCSEFDYEFNLPKKTAEVLQDLLGSRDTINVVLGFFKAASTPQSLDKKRCQVSI